MSDKVPRHVAIIMDGNGRWAKQRGLARVEGHRAGAEAVKRIVKAASEAGVEVLTLFAFSTENWSRPRDEVDALMALLLDYLSREIEELDGSGIRLKIIGDRQRLPKAVQESIEDAVNKTKSNSGMTLVLCISYGGRWDIIQAVRKIAARAKEGDISPQEIDEGMLASFLETAGLPDPDLLVRTSGEMRVSNFLLWQMAYSEIWVTPVLWPDFNAEHLAQALQDYAARERRFGAIQDGSEREQPNQ